MGRIVRCGKAHGEGNPPIGLVGPRQGLDNQQRRRWLPFAAPARKPVEELPVFPEPEGTAFDLRFRVFSTPVRVNIWFWVFSALIGWDSFSSPGGNIGYLALW